MMGKEECGEGKESKAYHISYETWWRQSYGMGMSVEPGKLVFINNVIEAAEWIHL